MFIVIYRWKLKRGTEERFREGWRRATQAISLRYGALGSRLHRAEDGSFVAYAQWPDKQHWEDMRKGPPADPQSLAAMRDCVDASVDYGYPFLAMDVTDDYFKHT
jgi:heme-degrading monooxygenase HmoA